MKKLLIYPSVLALQDNPQSWDIRLAELPLALAGIHYDIGDGDFVPSRMLPPENIGFLHTELPIDVHLMVCKPSGYFEALSQFPGVSAVAFHVECDEDIHENIQTLKNSGKKVGLSLLDTTPADHLDQYILEIDYVIVMTIKGGYSGTPFILQVLEKIREIHNKKPELHIVVDGGVNCDTFPLCAEAGATGVVMSSALFSGKDINWLL